MLQKRLDYGFNGYQVPFVPRAPRSTRRRGPIRKKVEDNQMHAFDLLATVAGKLLLEEESPKATCSGKDQAVNAEDVVMKEPYDVDNQLKFEHCDLECSEILSPSLFGSQGEAGHCNVEDVVGSQHDIYSTSGSVITLSDCLEKDDSRDKIQLLNERSGLCSDSGKQEDFSPIHHMESFLPDVNVNEFVEPHEGEGEVFLGDRPDLCSLEDPKCFNDKQLAIVNRSHKVSFGENQHTSVCGSYFPPRISNVKVVDRDDDENSSECTQPRTMKTTKSWTRIGDRRIRKILASKYWRVAPKLKDGDLSEFRSAYRSRKYGGYKRQRSQRIYPLKKRKLYHYSTLSNSVEDIACKGVYMPPEKADDMTAVRHGVNGSSCCVPGQSANFPSRESRVKLKIKSFRVPELFVEMPETATIGSLKRSIMDAVKTLIEGGLRIGVLYQGKKIRDDNRTLLQFGICHDEKVESLGFTLEPNPSDVRLPVCSEDNSLVLSTDAATEPISRWPATSTLHRGNSYVSSDHPATNLVNFIESDHDSAPSPADFSSEKGTADSQSLVAFPTPQALAVVPVSQRSKRSEIGQRRIRRPFSVAEVEALVQAVEKLGTGRWRDVKLQAFDNANHRTYVDLKDKWKTLVHTARIAPQQRRGQPVPQEVLDRVLAAHAYWSQQQQLKQQSEVCHFL